MGEKSPILHFDSVWMQVRKSEKKSAKKCKVPTVFPCEGHVEDYVRYNAIVCWSLSPALNI